MADKTDDSNPFDADRWMPMAREEPSDRLAEPAPFAPGDRAAPALRSEEADGDALNALAERELAALGEDRFPSDDGDDARSEDDEEHGADDRNEAPVMRTAKDDDHDSDEDASQRPMLIDGDEEGPLFSPAGWSRRRSWPLALLAMAGLAVLLLLVGGYGVMAEREALRAEIRELQARLANTASEPRKQQAAAVEAEAIARLARLERELATLIEENRVLRERLGELKESLDASAAGMMTTDSGPATAPVAAPPPAARERTAALPIAAKPAQAAPAGGWFVNFGSYADRGIAERRAAALSVDAGRVVVQDADTGGRTVYRVRVIGIDSREAADALARRLAATYELPPLWVGRE